MEFKYTPHNLQKIESIFKSNDFIVRYEKGHFQSGYCILLDKKVVVVNKFFDTEARIHCLIDIMKEIDIKSELIQDEKLEKIYFSLIEKNTKS